MTANHDIAKLDDLIVTTIDSIYGYEHSAKKAEAARFADAFTDMASQRRQVVLDLQAQSRALGGTPNDFGSTAATIHRRVEDLRVALGGGDTAIISEIERGEDYLKEEYERALADTRMSDETRSIIQTAYTSVRKGHDLVSHWKHSEAAE